MIARSKIRMVEYPYEDTGFCYKTVLEDVNLLSEASRSQSSCRS